MLYCDRIDISNGIDTGKSSDSTKCMVCHYWSLNHGFKYQDFVCNGCHDLLMRCFNSNGIVIINEKVADYRCIIYGISKLTILSLHYHKLMGRIKEHEGKNIWWLTIMY